MNEPRPRGAGPAVVLLSGGMDSTAALYWALERYDAVRALTCEYGQRHWIELDHARRIAGQARVPHSIVTLGAKGVGVGSLLTASKGKITEQTSVVPGRNLLLLWAAGVYAQAHGATRIVIGACAEDQAVYADCRPETFAAMCRVLELGLGWQGRIKSPYINKSKVDILRDAQQLGCLDAVRSSWSCYDPQQVEGQTCDVKMPCKCCPACTKRIAAFAAFEAAP